MELKNFTPRKYQEKILETSKNKNTLVVLPTGLGKTACAIMLAADRLNKYPDSKILICSPTKPLCDQHTRSFRENTDIDENEIVLFTGATLPKKREELWNNGKIIIATPQCVTGETQIFTKESGPIYISKLFESLNFKKDILYGKPAFSCKIKKKVLGYKKNKLNFLTSIKMWKTYTDKIVKIKTELNEELQTTLEHPILSITPGGKLIWKEARFLREKEFIGIISKIDLKEEKINLYDFCKTNELRLINKKSVIKLLKILKGKKIKISKFNNYRFGSFPLKTYLDLCDKHKIKMPDNLIISNKTGKSKPFKLPKKMSTDIAYIMGAMLGDGHIGNRSSEHGNEVVLTDLDRPNIAYTFKKKIMKIFGILPKEDNRKGLIYYSTALATVLNLLGIPKGDKSKILRVPKFIFFESKKVIGAFIGGLFNADDNVGKKGIHIHTSNKEFSKDLQWLLKRLGIVSFISSRKQNRSTIRNRIIKRGWLYGVHISGRKDIEEFLRWCNPDKKKCRTLLQNLKKVRRPYTKSKDILPIEQGLKLAYKEYRKNGGISLKEVLNAYNQKALSKHNLSLILPKLARKSKIGKELIKLINLPIRWVRIKSIRNINKKTKVYDLTVDKFHNFITNQIISHNTIESDIKNNRISLENFSMLCIDEAHRSKEKFANTIVAKNYVENSLFPRILALTASPGSTKEKINEIRKNLFIEAIEIRTTQDEDVKQYIKEKEINWIEVELPIDIKNVSEKLKLLYKSKLTELTKFGLNKPVNYINKRDLLQLQIQLQKEIQKGNNYAYHAISNVATIIKLNHCIELLETQGTPQFKEYILKLKGETSKAAKSLLNEKSFSESLSDIDKIDVEHPKLERLCFEVDNYLKENKDIRIMVFANYRNTVKEIMLVLKKIDGARPIELIGQKEGLTQKEQIERIKEFSSGKYNVLIGTAISEEGIHIANADHAIFYEPTPSEIRDIQRRGRVGRLTGGKIIILITKDTKDVAYYWTAKKKEQKMKNILNKMQNDSLNKKW